MKSTRIVATLGGLVALALIASGCCGGACDAAQSPEARKSFMTDYNKNGTGCSLSGEGDLLSMDMSCPDKEVGQIRKEVEAGCIGFKIVGVQSVSLAGKDGGTSSCSITDCSCSE